MLQRLPYAGTQRKLVLALDIGTTFSGVSYCILDPGKVPEIKGVTRFPAQEQVGGDSKIPTVIYYDKGGNVRAVGAEAVREGFEDVVEEGWVKAEWFKLHLRPKPESNLSETIPPLPIGRTVVDLFADFMRYLYENARTYIQDTHANGARLWESVENDIQFVLTHPNGWEGAQQAQMRKAAIHAGLVPDTQAGRARVCFVTEGEASLHFCISKGLMTSTTTGGNGILIVDAGGGTVDLSAYSQDLASAGPSYKESAPPQCHFHGSVFVTRRARKFFGELLEGSKFQEDIDHIANCFDKTAKLRFRNRDEPQYIKFGGARDADFKLGIRSGQLKLSGTDIASFFEPSLRCITEAILEMHKVTAKSKISSVFLVGGFASSDWLFSQIKKTLAPLNIDLCRPECHVNKAVADGGISYYVDHFVTARVAKYTYGIGIDPHYNPTDHEHLQRSPKMYIDEVTGTQRLPQGFSTILSKDTVVTETREFRERYTLSYYNIQYLPLTVTTTALCYGGSLSLPRWLDVEPHNYSTFCTIAVAGASLKDLLTREIGPSSKVYYRLTFELIFKFGLTELTAEISYSVNGQEKRVPVEIVYEMGRE